jgi:PAS domain S-box-containing protein
LRSLNTYREGSFGRRWLVRCAIAGLAGVCFAVSASALEPTRTVSQYLHDSWGTERGWPGGSITAIAQSSDGFLWIGTDKGLVRFDGLNFRQFQLAHPDPIWIGPVRTLVVDASDNLWILLQNTLVFRYKNGNFELIRGETENGTTAMARGTSGAVLLSSLAEGTLTYSDNRFRSLSSAALLTDAARVANSEAPDQRATPFSWFDRLAAPTSVVISMAQTDDGKIWLGTEHQGLFYLQGGRVSSASNGRLDTKINCLLPLQNSELWVGTAKGVLRWSGTKLTSAGVPSSLLNLDVLSILRDRDSNIWVGTSRGLFRYNTNGVTLLSTTGPVAALFEDREGDIWIGGTRGLERLRDSAFVTYSLPNLKSQSMGPLHVDSAGRTWIAPIQGGLRWLKGGKTGVVTADGIANDVVYSIAGTGKDDVWVGRQQGGLTHLRYSGNSFTTRTYTQADGLAQNRVYAVYRSRDGTVWSGTLSGGVSELKNGHFTNYTTADGLAANTISSIAEGPDGTMWFGTPNGVSAMSQKGWRTYAANDGLPSEDVNCLLQDSTRILWIGTAEGLAYLSDGQVHVPRGLPGSLQAPIFGIEEDKNGWLWIVTSDHVLRVPRDKLLSGVVKADDVREYDQADGLESTEGVKRSRSVVSDSAGRIWFSLSSGLSVINPSQITNNSVPALPHIEAITADNNTANLGASVRIPPTPRRITFDYTGLSLGVPGRIRFRYFLEGFDSSWSQPVAAREAVYTNLGPGSYRFRLVASNSDGLWNGPESAITLNVAPAYYQTVWFRSLGVFLFLAVLTGLYRLRLRNLERQRDALRKSEKELRDVIDTIPAMVWSTLPDGSNTYVNKRFVEYTGSSAEQTAGSGWQALIHSDDLKRHAGKWMEAVATGKPYENEVRSRRADGQYRWQLDRGVPLRDEDGNIVKWYGVTSDIEDRKRAEEALQQSQFYLGEGQHLAHMGSWALNPSGFFEHWSQELFKIYGLDPQKGAPTLEQYLATVHPADRDFMAETIRKMQAEHSGCDVKKRIVRPDGEQRYIRCVGIPVVEGEVLKGFLGTAIDITEQELLTQELERQQAHLTEAQKLTHTGSWAWRLADRKMKTEHLSEEWYRIYGFDPAEGAPTREEYFERVHPEDLFEFKDIGERAIVEKADYDHEFRILLPNGMVKWIHTVGHPVLSNTGDLEGFVGSSTDITELKSAEQEREKLRQLEADLAHTNRVSTLGEMAASLAHEIKQPIAAAITSANSCVEWLAHEPPNLDRARAAAGRIDKYGNRAAEIIDRIRSLYRKSPPQRELADVNGIIEEMLMLLEGEATRSAIAMRPNLSAELPKIMVDRVQLQQVFMNLMLNAIEAMTHSGGELAVKSELQDGQLQFSVSDTGVGLPAEKMDQIFSAFFTTKPQGSGMGLAISRSIVESHGGQLWASANSGAGATFYFTLPIQVTESSPLVA